MVFKKIIFQIRYVALETPSRPPPFMAKDILNFHFDYLKASLRWYRVSMGLLCLYSVYILKKVEIWLGVADAHRLTDRQQNKVLLSLSKV